MCVMIPKVQKPFPLADDQENTPNILQDLYLLLTILKAVGLFPYFTKTSSNEIEPPSRQKCLYSTFIRVLSHTCTIFILYNTFRKHSFHLFNADRDTDNINQYIEMFINITTYTGTSILCAKHSKLLFRILSDSLKLDADIQQRYGVYVQNQSKYIKLNTFLVILCQIFIIGIKMKTSLGVFYQHYFMLGFYAVQSVICSVFVLLMSSIFRVISIRFEFVNMILNNYSYKMGELKLQETSIIGFREDVSTAFQLHNRLLKIYKMLNESTSLLVALLLGYAFYSITTSTYNIFVEFTTKRNVSVALLLNCFTWLAFNSALLVTITSRCGETTRKANTTSQILARVYGKSRDYQNIIDKFLTKSIRQEVQFTAYGFFVVDNSTLFKIFSAVTTYLVILIQFKQLEDTKLDESLDNKL